MGMEANISAVRAGETKVSAPKPRSGSKKNRDMMDPSMDMMSRSLDKNGYPTNSSDEFLMLLQEHCVPIMVNIPPQIAPELLQEFCHLYRNHCQRIVSMLSIKEFVNVRSSSLQIYHM